ncbi:MAG: TPM domain-containing protein [Bacteroidales bacterium]|nr:TPM domain-containing protein [Bacteroidales bacterium]
MGISARNFFLKEEKIAIKEAIENAELDTSGEVRVHIENVCDGDVMDKATYIFKKLKMHKTQLRNGVLFYLAVKNRKFAIIGDSGINSTVPEDFWDNIKLDLLNNFREDKFADGLINGITKTGEQLKKHFPYQTDDVNELSDEISFGDN